MEEEKNIIKSPHDHRIYKTVTLPNNFSCLMISDEKCDKSAASLMISVGMAEDPIEVDYNSFFFILIIVTRTCSFSRAYAVFGNRKISWTK